MPRMARGTTHPPITVPPIEGDGLFQQPLREKWLRRAITIPATVLIAALWTVAMTVLVPYGVIADLVRGRKQLLLRFHLLIAGVLWWQVVGVLGLFAVWLVAPPFLVAPETWREANRRYEVWWANWMIAWPELLYGMHFEVEGLSCARPGPVLLFARHASIIDTILPIKLLGSGLGMTMRIVKKRELLNVPGVDIIAHRLPRTFVRRGSGNPEAEQARVMKLLEGISSGDALQIFPEGSRFTPAKKAQVVERLRQRHPEAAARAEELQKVLPIRPAGALALLNARPDIDLVFMAHTGLEGANRLDDFIGGALLDRTIKVKLWRVSARQVPRDEEEKLIWLHQQWKRVDDWVVENQDPDLANLDG
jgi:1-acyl-sn-glycerol-3-phosphate acyltransferase